MSDDDKIQAMDARINRALGLFLLLFGLVVFAAVFFTPDRVGKLINGVSAAILVGIGAGMVFHARHA